MKEKRPALIVFCKNPIEGKAKTRLAKTLGTSKALAIYKRLIQKTAEVVKSLDEVDVFVFYSHFIPETDAFHTASPQRELQKGKDLGERMGNAFQRVFKTHAPAVIIGTDLWELSPLNLETAFSKLHEKEAVIGPAKDGGYYLLGLQKFHAPLFQNKTWSSEHVFTETLNDLKTKEVFLLEVKNDIDTEEDIQPYPDLHVF